MLLRYLFHLHQLRKNLDADQSKLQSLQHRKLRAVIKYAYEHVLFYHRKFDDAGIKPDDVKSVDDLSMVPVTTKSEIQKRPIEDLVSKNVDLNRCVKTMTSGSTGIPLAIVGDGASRDVAGAVWARALLENGLRLRDRMAIIKNPSYFEKNQGLRRLLRRKYISVFDSVEQQISLLEDFRPDIIKGYPQSLDLVADACRNNERHVKPRLIFTGGELLDEKHRSLISSVFECEVFDYYGCVEFGLLMWECSEHTGYHRNIDSVVTEFLNDGEVVGPGERGEIVCTGLHNFVMPLIRYRLDDVGIPVEDRCSCGRSLPLMKMMEGRIDDILRALDGRAVYASSFFCNLFGNLEGIRQFRVIQERRDKLTVQLIARERFLSDNRVLDRVRREIKGVFGEGISVDFQIVEKLDRDPTGKLKIIISNVP